MKKWLINRLQERTTYIGMGALLVAIFNQFGIDICTTDAASADNWGNILSMAVFALSGGAVVLPSPKIGGRKR